MSSKKVVGMAEWKNRTRGEFELTADKLLEKAWFAAGIHETVSAFHMPAEPAIILNSCVVETQNYAQLADHALVLAHSVNKIESKITAKWQIFQVINHGQWLRLSPVVGHVYKGYVDHWLPLPSGIPEIDDLVAVISGCLEESWEHSCLNLYDDMVLQDCYSLLSNLLGLKNAIDHGKITHDQRR